MDTAILCIKAVLNIIQFQHAGLVHKPFVLSL